MIINYFALLSIFSLIGVLVRVGLKDIMTISKAEINLGGVPPDLFANILGCIIIGIAFKFESLHKT